MSEWTPRILLVCAALCVGASPGAAQQWESRTLSRAFNGERALEVDVEYGAGQLRIAPGRAGSLYHAALRYDASAFEPRTAYEDGRLRIGLEGEQIRGRKVRGGNLTLELGPDVPLELDLAFGAAEAELELGGLALESLEISTGASSTVLSFSTPNTIEAESIALEVGAARFEARGLGNARAHALSVEGGVGEIDLDFSGAWSHDLDATVEMGLGKLTLRLPRGLGIRLEKDGLLTKIDGSGLVRRGDVYYSENFDAAERKLTVDVDAAFNAIQIVWVGSLQATP